MVVALSRTSLPMMGGGHWHVPATHALLPLHAVAQLPQWFLSLLRSWQVEPHSEYPGCVQTHEGPTHWVPTGQALSHAPQWFGFDWMLVQAPVDAHQS
jgi:hypothetical protein